jgi:hypothetical protein
MEPASQIRQRGRRDLTGVWLDSSRDRSSASYQAHSCSPEGGSVTSQSAQDEYGCSTGLEMRSKRFLASSGPASNRPHPPAFGRG